MSLYSDTIEVLTPLVGRPAAEICLRSSAVKLGKSAEDFGQADADEVFGAIRASMSAFASSALLEQAITQIKVRQT